ncbi:MAG TPA: glucokinase, partial [Pseudolabrys sp.]|nr:glucokinase [Pseudolabrys sp.]
ADIGATNTRLALVEPGGAASRIRVFATDESPDLGDMIETYLAAETLDTRPVAAVLAIAAPVTGDEITLTNFPWTFSIHDLRERLGLKQLRVINDFVANAYALPHLGPDDCTQVGGGSAVAGAPCGVLGPGSGLGVSALVPADGGPAVPIRGEGGHVTMAPANAHEAAVLDLMRRRFDHVSAERVLSGPGILNLYNALCELAGEPQEQFTPAQITDARTGEEHPRAREATEMFCAMLGTIAGNLALTLGARGGIFIAGGIVPRLGARFAESQFRTRFEAKGRFREYLAAVPTYVITRPFPALVGTAKLLETL